MDFVGIIVATVVASTLGGVWYTALFGKFYRRSLGRESQAVDTRLRYILGPAITGLITVIAISVLIDWLQITTVQQGLELGALLGTGLLATTTINTGINPNIPRPGLYGVISGGYFFLMGVLVTLILVLL